MHSPILYRLGVLLILTALIFTVEPQIAKASITIDSFETSQSLTAEGDIPPDNVEYGTVIGADIAGTERDAYIEITEGVNYLTLKSNDGGNGLLAHSQETGVKGISLLVWDGPDGDPLSIDYTGLGGMDLTSAGVMDHVKILVYEEDWPADIVFSVYSDAGNWSSYELNLPGLIEAPGISFYLPFTDFTVQAGTGADFTNVGALSMEIVGHHVSTDLRIQSVEAVTASIGDYVWFDEDMEGDQDEDPALFGLNDVVIELYEDENCDGIIDPEDDLLATHTTQIDPLTGLPGWYLFNGLQNGCYVVNVDESSLPDGFVLTTNNEPHPVNLAIGQNYTDADFGYWMPPQASPTPVVTPTPAPCEPRTPGYWKVQCRKHQHENPEPYFPIIREASAIFDEIGDASCDTVMSNPHGMMQKALWHSLSTWLNISSGKLSMDTPVDFPQLTAAVNVGQAIEEIEMLILAEQELERAKDIADAINNGWALDCNDDPLPDSGKSGLSHFSLLKK